MPPVGFVSDCAFALRILAANIDSRPQMRGLAERNAWPTTLESDRDGSGIDGPSFIGIQSRERPPNGDGLGARGARLLQR